MIYLDYAASAPMYPEAAEELKRCSLEAYANPAGLHCAASSARSVLQRGRKTIAELLDVPETSVIFCSGGTEANNHALRLGAGDGPGEILTDAAEHASVLRSARSLKGRGITVRYVVPGRDGRIDPDDLEREIRPETRLISIQSANNETGVLQDAEAFAKIADRHGIPYHCDAVQSFGHCRQPLAGAGLITVSAHKLGGPRGIGCLVVRQDMHLPTFLYGGGQEFGMRPGTENTAAVSAFALAALLSDTGMRETENRIRKLRDRLAEGLSGAVPGTVFHGGGNRSLPGIINCSFPDISGEEMQMRLSLRGICVSTGSACGSADPAPSGTLLAMGISAEEAKRSVRFSIGRLTTADEIDETVAAVSGIVSRRGS